MTPSGGVFQAGPTIDTMTFDPSAQAWSPVANMHRVRNGAAAVLLPSLHQVLIAGGDPVTRTAEIIDLAKPAPRWNFAAPMTFSRVELNLVLLPDATVLAVGGGATPSGDYRNPRKQPELYNPATGRWMLMAPQKAQRTYHSTALLLPDGRVLSAGSDSGPLQTTIELFSPPYLFRGARPTISSGPDLIKYGDAFVIGTPDSASINRVALIRPGAVTHANNFDQRYVALRFSAGNGQLNAVAPSSPNDAPPGYYMLFIVRSNGVPGVAKFIHLG